MVDTTGTPGWKHRLFIVGHVAKGLVFVMIGGLGTYAVIRDASDPEGMLDVLVWLYTRPFGKALVALLGVGLLAHGVWRWWKVFDSRSDGKAKLVAIGERVGHVVGGTFYILLSVFAFSMLWQKPKTGTGEGNNQQVLQFTLDIPWGEWLVGLVGGIVIVVGIIMAVQGTRQQLMERMDTEDMKTWQRRLYRGIGMAGFISWGMVTSVIGYFLIRVAVTQDPERYRGIKGALEFMGGRTFGMVLLGAVSLGLLLFGLFMFTKARYHQTT